MSEPSGPPTLSLALGSVLSAAVDGHDRATLLAAVRPPVPAPRRPDAGETLPEAGQA